MGQYRTWIEISKTAIKHNYNSFRRILKKETKMLGVVKSNAYGHELFRFGQSLSTLGVNWLGVDSITEALALRKVGLKTPILVLGYTLPQNFIHSSLKNISLTISSFESLKIISRLKHKISIQLKIDTGMHRQGFFVSDIPKILVLLKKMNHVNVNGFYTHFAAAKKPDTGHETQYQINEFKKVISLIKHQHPRALAHASATAGTLNYPEAHFDMVRIGIGLYGLWPSEETKKAFSASKFSLKPVLTWKTIISEVKTLEKGQKIGYDFTEKLARRSKIAILPIGYWHGYWRAFSSKAQVLIKGRPCKVLGRVSMDMIVVDVTDAGNISVGDEAVLIGKQKKQEITVDTLAKIAGTTNYEVVTRLNPLIKKNYTT